MKTPSGSELWVLKLMAERGRALVDAAGLVVVLRHGRELQVPAAAGVAEARVRVLPVRGSALGELIDAQLPLRLERPSVRETLWLAELGVEARAALVVRLVMERHGDGLIIALRSAEPTFGDADVRALGDFARSMAERLVAERSVELQRLRHGVEVRERERTRWARELHDETVQELGALRLMLAGARDGDDPETMRRATGEALTWLDREIEALRHLITDLRPAALDDLGLVAALQALARRASAIDGLAVEADITLEQDGDTRLQADLEGAIYRMIQEALTNVAKHSGAHRARVGVHAEDGRVIATVADDGTGFADAEPHAGYGLEGMRERAELVGGELEVLTRPRGGTIVRLSVPIGLDEGDRGS